MTTVKDLNGNEPSVNQPRMAGWSARALQIAGLWALAVAQPLFDLLARQPEVLVAHHLGAAQLILFAGVLALVPAAAAAALLAAIQRVAPSLARWLGAVLVWGLAVALLLLMLRRIAWLPPGFHLAVAAAVGLWLALAAGRQPMVQSGLCWLAVAVVVCPLVFLASPSLRSLLRPSEPALGEDVEAGLETKIEVNTAAPAVGAPVIMVLFDEWPLASVLDADGTLNAARYPNLARFAAGAHWFRNATTVAHSTAYAVPAILSGRYPDQRRLPIATDYPRNLFTLLASAGYAMNVVEPHTDLCPESLCFETDLTPSGIRVLASDLRVIYLHLITPRAWRHRLPTVGESWSHFANNTASGSVSDTVATKPPGRAQRRRWMSKRSPRDQAFHNDPVGSFRTFVATIDPAARPTLHFLHVMLPHMPWRHLPDGRRYEPTSASRSPHGLVNQFWKGTPFEVLQAQQRHLLQVAAADHLIGELVAALEANGLFDPALIVLVADHGTSFVPKRMRRNLSEAVIADIANVPLLIKMPHQRAGVLDDRNAETIDIVPTVTHALGIPVATPLDGHDLLGAPWPSTSKRTFRSGLAGLGPGRALVYDVATLEAQRQASVEQILSHFGRRPHEVFALGDVGGLVGQGLASLAIAAEPVTINVRVDQVLELGRVNLEAPQLPVRLTGAIHSIEPKPRTNVADFDPHTIALVLDGVVRAVTKTHLDHDAQERFSALIERRALRAGKNHLALFEVTGTPAQPRLAALALRQAESFLPFAAGFEDGDGSEWSQRRGLSDTAR